MAETRYDTRYDRSERNMMWTIAFVVLLLVLIVWGLWYFNRPDVGAAGAGTTTGIATDTVSGQGAATTGAGADIEGTAGADTTGGAMGSDTGATGSMDTTGTTY